MKYGLSEKQLQDIATILAAWPDIDSVWLFGSRALGTYKEASDIDLAIKGHLNQKTLVRLKDAFEDSDLPFFVDLVEYAGITEPTLKKHIDDFGIVLYKAGKVINEWKPVNLGEICRKIGSGATPTGGSNVYQEAGIPLIRSQNVLDFCFSKDGLAFINDDQAYELRNVTVEEKDVLLNITGDSVARCCVVPKPLTPARVNQHVAIIRPIPEKASHLFIFYLLQQIKEELLMKSEIGATRRALTKSMLENLEIELPPLPEQKAIAAVLSSLDDKIDLLHRQNKTLEAMAETLFRQWFVEEAQEDWEDGTIADLIEFNPSRKLIKGSIAPYLEMAVLSNTTFNPDGWYDREFSSGTKFINGDTLLARITPCLENGKSAYVTFLQDGQVAWGSTEYIVMRPKGNLHPFFAYTLARSSDFRDYAEGCLAGSSGRQRVDVDHLKNYGIKIPPEETIEGFNAFAESIVPKLHSNAQQIRTLETLRDTLLPKLMSGEVRVAY